MDLNFLPQTLQVLGKLAPWFLLLVIILVFIIYMEKQTSFFSNLIKIKSSKKKKILLTNEEIHKLKQNIEQTTDLIKKIKENIEMTNQMIRMSRQDMDKTKSSILDIGATLEQIASTQESLSKIMSNNDVRNEKIADTLSIISIFINRMESEKESEIKFQKKKLEKMEKTLINYIYDDFVDNIINSIINQIASKIVKDGTVNIKELDIYKNLEVILSNKISEEFIKNKNKSLLNSESIVNIADVASKYNWTNVAKLIKNILERGENNLEEKRESIKHVLYAEQSVLFDKIFIKDEEI